MDSSLGTHKPQYCFGGVTLLILFILLHVVSIFFMIPGHSKFLPDDMVRKVAGIFEKKDPFNQGMLLRWIQACATGIDYNETTLNTYKVVTKKLFSESPGILKNRKIILVSDDGLWKISFGSDGTMSEGDLAEDLVGLNTRSMRKVLAAIKVKVNHGIGAGMTFCIVRHALCLRMLTGRDRPSASFDSLWRSRMRTRTT